jgi:hypothetical protein
MYELGDLPRPWNENEADYSYYETDAHTEEEICGSSDGPHRRDQMELKPITLPERGPC